jgi:DNA-binding PadR family transcriptional regulator
MPASLGDLDLLVLLALLRLGADGYGVAVQREIAERTGRETALGAVYAALNRLEARGLVAAKLGPPTPVRGGRRKKLYVVLPSGREAVREAWNDLRALTRGIAPRLGLT